MQDVMQIANGIPMWIACGIPVLMVVFQAAWFAKKAYGAGEKVGLTKERMNKAIKSSAITSIGPSIVVLSGMLSLLITVGAPMAWMRLSLIGSVMFESIAAGIGTQQVNVTLGTDPMTLEALTMAIWTMVLCSIGWVIFATFSASRMDKVEKVISGGDSKKLIAISTAAVIGVFCAMVAQHLVKVYDFKAHTFALHKNAIAAVLGGLTMFICIKISDKFKPLKEWNLTIAILIGMIITAILPL